MLYRVTVYRPNPYERCFEAKESWIVGNLKVAKLTALEKLPTAYETVYMADLKRFPYAEIAPVKRFASKVSKVRRGSEMAATGQSICIDTPICYVPSVGDLGYTP